MLVDVLESVAVVDPELEVECDEVLDSEDVVPLVFVSSTLPVHAEQVHTAQAVHIMR